MGVIFIMINLVNGDRFIEIVVYGFEDVDFVVIKVCEVFDDGCWFKMYLFVCKDVLICFCKLMICNQNELVVIESFDSGKIIYDCVIVDIFESIYCIKWYVEVIDKIYDQVFFVFDDYIVMVVCEFIGVVGLVLFWNFLFLMLVWKIGFVLVVGCLVVVKFVEEISLLVLCFVEFVFEVGLFVGVFNIFSGGGVEVGEFIGCYMDIDMVFFIGFIVIGKCFFIYVVESNVKEVVLEMGGKNFVIVMDDVENFDCVV